MSQAAFDRPRVSIVITAFRHAKYVGEALESCLGQTLSDIEVIVVDDGSHDGTAAVLGRCRDPRLVTVVRENGGPSIATNHGIQVARAPVLAFLSADDRCFPDRVERQLAFLEGDQYDAVFGRPALIDEDGSSLPDARMTAFFAQPATTSSHDLLRALFFEGNRLCAPSAMIRRSALEACGLFHPTLYQLQDFEMWLRLCTSRRVALSDERVVESRIRADNANLSSLRNLRRTRAEQEWIYSRMLTMSDAATLTTVFGSELAVWGLLAAEPDDKRIALSLLHQDPHVRRYGLERLMDRFGWAAATTGEIRFSHLTLAPRDMAAILAIPT